MDNVGFVVGFAVSDMVVGCTRLLARYQGNQGSIQASMRGGSLG